MKTFKTSELNKMSLADLIILRNYLEAKSSSDSYRLGVENHNHLVTSLDHFIESHIKYMLHEQQ